MSNPGPRANPAAVLLGNPPRAAKRAGRKERPMAKKKSRKSGKRRSAAQRAATKKMLAANRAKRGTKRAARKSKAKTGKRRSGRRTRRASKAAPIVKRIYVTKPRKGKARRKVKIEIRRVKRHSKRRARAKGRLLRTLSLNPAVSLRGFIAPITGVIGNLKQSISSAAGIAGLAGGAVGAVAGGTLLARFIMPLAMRFVPAVATNPMGARVISAGLYYGAGFALAKLLPVNEKIKRGILGGAVVAAIIEVIRPGTVQRMVAAIPGVGPMIAGNLGGIEPELGAYVEQALNGLGMSTNEMGGAAYALGDYRLDGLGDYRLGEYDQDSLGLGCADPASVELVSFDD